MKNFLTVFKFLLIQNLSPKNFVNKMRGDKKQRKMLFLFIIILLMSLPTYGSIIKLLVDLFDVINNIKLGEGVLIKQGSLFIVFGVLASAFIIILFGMYQIISYFYFSNEVKILTTLPIKTVHILISKFFVIYVLELMISAFLVLPIFIIYGVKSNLNIIQWIYLAISTLILPIIPLVLVGLIAILIMRFTHLFKKRDLIRFIGLFVFLAIAIGGQVGLNQFILNFSGGPDQQQQQLQSLIGNNNFLTERAGKIYPIIILVNNAVSKSFLIATLNLFILIIVSLVVFYFFVIILKEVYLKSYLAEQEITLIKAKGQKRNKKNGHASLSIAKIDFLTLLRVPIYLFNSLSIVVIVPLFLIIMPLLSGGESLLNIDNLYGQFTKTFWVVLTIIITTFTTLNPIASTTFSREGKTNWIMRTLPISSKDHIKGRFYTPFITQVIFSIINTGVLLIIINRDIHFAILSIIFSILGAIPLILVGINIDLNRPVLKWDNPQQAIKQNLNVLVSMGFGLAWALIMGGLYIGLNILSKYNQLFGSLLLYMLLFIIINSILIKFIYQQLIKNFEVKLISMT